jgi:two-component system sensor histidine kinase KdpD
MADSDREDRPSPDALLAEAQRESRGRLKIFLGAAPKTVEYRGRVFNEMDLEAILERRPALVLVDELAHTNVPGSRHVKRFQDVEEILDAGIKVREILPGSSFSTADEGKKAVQAAMTEMASFPLSVASLRR